MTKNVHRFEFRLGRTGLILFVAGVSVMIFGVFLLGVTVGKNIDAYPGKIARYLPERFISLIRPPTQPPDPDIVAEAERKPESPLDLTFYKTLGKRKADGQDGKDREPESPLLKRAPEKGAKELPPPPSAPLSVAVPVPAPASPAIQPKPSSPAPTPQADAPAKSEKFLVQVVAYQQKSKADALVKKIAAMGKPARMESTELPDKGKWYRVVMGEFSSRGDAQGAVDVLSKKIKGLNCVIRPVE
jgi:cell division septation protein DedD